MLTIIAQLFYLFYYNCAKNYIISSIVYLFETIVPVGHCHVFPADLFISVYLIWKTKPVCITGRICRIVKLHLYTWNLSCDFYWNVAQEETKPEELINLNRVSEDHVTKLSWHATMISHLLWREICITVILA